MAKSDKNTSNQPAKPKNTNQEKDVISSAVPKPTKTPFYQATNAIRYQRQAIIHNIEELTGAKLICYVAGIQAPIDRDDIVAFVDLLHNIDDGVDLDIMLHTAGGDIDAAEKIITMLRNKVGAARLRIIVPDFAKSAGTLIALGADSIVMSDSSELGPIDPQVIRTDENGNRIGHSVQRYLDAYNAYADALNKNHDDAVAKIMLNKLDPTTIKVFEAIMKRARRLAENLLRQGMFKNGGNVTATAGELIDTNQWLLHGQMISWEAAADPKIGLSVEYLSQDSELWAAYWRLYCLQRLAVTDIQKLFESEYASLCLESKAS